MKNPLAQEINKIIESFQTTQHILLFPYKSLHDTNTFIYKHIFYKYALRYNHFMKFQK